MSAFVLADHADVWSVCPAAAFTTQDRKIGQPGIRKRESVVASFSEMIDSDNIFEGGDAELLLAEASKLLSPDVTKLIAGEVGHIPIGPSVTMFSMVDFAVSKNRALCILRYEIGAEPVRGDGKTLLAVAAVALIAVHPVIDVYEQIEITIVQPRNWLGETVRTVYLTAGHVLKWLKDTEKSFSGSRDTVAHNPGPVCASCPRLLWCPAIDNHMVPLLNLGHGVYEDGDKSVAVLSREYRVLSRLKPLFDKRYSELSEYLISTIESGLEKVPGLAIEDDKKTGRETWAKGKEDTVRTIAKLFGCKADKNSELRTPKQLIDSGVPREAVVELIVPPKRKKKIKEI